MRDFDSYMERIIKDAIKSEIEKIIEEEIDSCHGRVVDRLRGKVGEIALSVSKSYFISRNEERLIIEIKDET